ncbi:MAG: Maf family nucleotide pyrophosphatase [Methylophilus sp.]|nr:Maf family nucleotide pyrophosphatase [Methylophilus sp.]MDP3609203.1 Maf family nucleotide pyrophosphatase [Methylophilus sp.]
MKQTIILASSSVYRRELLQKLQIQFSCVSPKVDETPLDNEKPHQTALRLSQEKAKKVADEYPHALVIGCDQVATLDNIPLGKPLNHQNAMKQLQLMRGREVTFYSALCLLNAATGNMQSEVVPTLVKFRQYSDQEIESYLAKDQPYQCAGSAKSEGLGIVLIERMIGEDPNALIGLPLIKLVTMLTNEKVAIV